MSAEAVVAELCRVYHDMSVEELEPIARELMDVAPRRLRAVLRALSTEMRPSVEKVRRIACSTCAGLGRVSVDHPSGYSAVSACPDCGNGARMPKQSDKVVLFPGGDAA